MELINQTGVPAELLVADTGMKEGERRLRTGCLLAKATFQMRGAAAELVTDDPLPILHAHEPTPLGDIPADVRAGMGERVEIVVLAQAHAPRRRPVEQMRVGLQVDTTLHELLVTGDRVWVGKGSDARPSAPIPFTTMPLTWTHAYGGTAEVWWDDHTRVPLQHPVNRAGLGFDAEGFARGMEAHCPPGYPRLTEERRLPNVEDPAHAIVTWADDPVPTCWAAHTGSQLVTGALAHRSSAPSPEELERIQGEGKRVSHAGLRLDAIEGPLSFRLTGCTDDGDWSFVLPPLRVSMDYALGARRGARTLPPYQVVILAEERRVTVTYQSWFKFWVDDESTERSVRLSVG
ncbi:MAG: DUF2169 domain-containing protein [Myxococcales bacterium]|nr:DUF2169 domain-containing protein [Myxococcales bacterium]